MARTPEERQRRKRILISLQVLRFAIAGVLLGLAIYYQDAILAVLAVVFVILGLVTTRLRMRADRLDDASSD